MVRRWDTKQLEGKLGLRQLLEAGPPKGGHFKGGWTGKSTAAKGHSRSPGWRSRAAGICSHRWTYLEGWVLIYRAP